MGKEQLQPSQSQEAKRKILTVGRYSSLAVATLGGLSFLTTISDAMVSHINAKKLVNDLYPLMPLAQVRQITQEQTDFNTAINNAIATDGDLTAVVEKMGGREKLQKDFVSLQDNQELLRTRTETYNRAYSSKSRRILFEAFGAIATVILGAVGLISTKDMLDGLKNQKSKQQVSPKPAATS